jgi:hypothetical protein
MDISYTVQPGLWDRVRCLFGAGIRVELTQRRGWLELFVDVEGAGPKLTKIRVTPVSVQVAPGRGQSVQDP